MSNFKCGRCGKLITKNVYYCSHCQWHLCWDCLRKAPFTTELSCPNPDCARKVIRVDK